MARRILLAAQQGCDAFEPDNGDANGLQLTEADQQDYNRWLSRQATIVTLPSH